MWLGSGVAMAVVWAGGIAPIRPLVWEPLCVRGAALGKKTKKKKKKKLLETTSLVER